MRARLLLPFTIASVAAANVLPAANAAQHSRELKNWRDDCTAEPPLLCAAGVVGNVGLFFADVTECLAEVEPGDTLFDLAECLWFEVIFDKLSEQEMETIENCFLAAACFMILPLEIAEFLVKMAHCIHDSFHDAIFHSENGAEVLHECLDEVFFSK